MFKKNKKPFTINEEDYENLSQKVDNYIDENKELIEKYLIYLKEKREFEQKIDKYSFDLNKDDENPKNSKQKKFKLNGSFLNDKKIEEDSNFSKLYLVAEKDNEGNFVIKNVNKKEFDEKKQYKLFEWNDIISKDASVDDIEDIIQNAKDTAKNKLKELTLKNNMENKKEEKSVNSDNEKKNVETQTNEKDIEAEVEETEDKEYDVNLDNNPFMDDMKLMGNETDIPVMESELPVLLGKKDYPVTKMTSNEVLEAAVIDDDQKVANSFDLVGYKNNMKLIGNEEDKEEDIDKSRLIENKQNNYPRLGM